MSADTVVLARAKFRGGRGRGSGVTLSELTMAILYGVSRAGPSGQPWTDAAYRVSLSDIVAAGGGQCA